jgi:N-acetylglutamate synthase-like GNAT family acetyltransferase
MPQTPTSPAGFKVRPARRGDAEAMGALLAELGYAGGVDSATVNWVVSHPEMEVLVAGDGMDRAIGMLTLSHRPQLRTKGRIATIDELVVTEKWRRRGVGRELIKRGIERAKVLTVKRLEVVTHPGFDEPTFAFFQSVGFIQAEARVFRLQAMDFQK